VTMRFLLDTNIVSDLVRHPRGRISDRISEVGEKDVCTSIVVAAELRYGSTKKNSSRLTAQLEAVLGAIEVLDNWSHPKRWNPRGNKHGRSGGETGIGFNGS
jgi:predicted nucleic acid-binding protein